jgi:hypothetical protein
LTRARALAAALLSSCLAAGTSRPDELHFGPGERASFRITYLKLLAGRASLSVDPAFVAGRFHLVAEARSQGFFAWLFRFRVDDRTVADWDPETGCSWGIEKRLHEGRAVRDQVVSIDPTTGVAHVRDPKIKQERFDLAPCVLDVLSAFYALRVRGVSEGALLELPVFDNGKHYRLGVRFLGRELLDLPAPFGKRTPTIVVEPQLLEGTGLFVKKGRLKIWLTDDERRVPVRMRSRVALGSVSADLEAYERGSPGAAGALGAESSNRFDEPPSPPGTVRARTGQGDQP